MDDDEILCRICYNDDSVEHLISPCLCTGSMKYIHLSCLNQWRSNCMKKTSMNVCEQCMFTYIIKSNKLGTFLKEPKIRHIIRCLFILIILGMSNCLLWYTQFCMGKIICVKYDKLELLINSCMCWGFIGVVIAFMTKIRENRHVTNNWMYSCITALVTNYNSNIIKVFALFGLFEMYKFLHYNSELILNKLTVNYGEAIVSVS